MLYERIISNILLKEDFLHKVNQFLENFLKGSNTARYVKPGYFKDLQRDTGRIADNTIISLLSGHSLLTGGSSYLRKRKTLKNLVNKYKNNLLITGAAPVVGIGAGLASSKIDNHK